MDQQQQVTPPASPRRLAKFPSTPGSPEPIPSSPEQDEIARELEHGPHGAQGGDEGNKYQVMWMTLACINAVYQPANVPKLVEIILEGNREPFDDIEIRKAADRLTLFQSKHRNKQGSNNITISELVEDPDKDTAPYSLLKYFRGMMKLISKTPTLVNANFIVCVSASFSTTFKRKIPNAAKPETVTVAQDFWQTTGFQAIPPNQLEPLLTNIFYRDHAQNETLEAYQRKQKNATPKYVRFSDAFINDQIPGQGKKLRDYLYNALVTFIANQRQKKAEWVNWPAEEDNNKIQFFFLNFQLWLTQPKLENLQKIVSEMLKVNIGLAESDFLSSLTKALEQSANRTQRSLLMKNIEGYLKNARGSVLTRYLGVVADQFRSRYLLDRFHTCQLHNQSLTQFLTSDQKICLLTSAYHKRLKYIAYCAAHAHFPAHKTFQENWFIVDGQSKPLFDMDDVHKKFIDHSPEDILEFQACELIIIDMADVYLSNKDALSVLKRIEAKLLYKTNCKLIIIASNSKLREWKKVFEKTPTLQHIIVDKPSLDDTQISTVIRHNDAAKQYVKFFDNQFLSFVEILKKVYPSVLTAMENPNNLVDILKDGKPAMPVAITNSNNEELSRYQALPIPCLQPIYKLSDIAKLGIECSMYLYIDKPGFEEQLKQIVSHDCKYDNKNKCYVFINIKNKTVLSLVLADAADLEHVLIKECDAVTRKAIIAIKPAAFKLNGTSVSPRQLILRNDSPQRTLIAADYGSGKSTLLRYLMQSWLEDRAQNSCEWMLLIKLPSIVKRIKKGDKLTDILAYQAKKNNMTKSELELWQKAVLQAAIDGGRLLLLCDGWDELKGDNIDTVNHWLETLPKTVGLIICSRPHAEASLTIALSSKITLNPFNWQSIRKYITSYFVCSNEIQLERHEAFFKRIFDWLGNGRNQDAIEVLQRPLHVALLCKALDFYYQRFLSATNEAELAIVDQQAPWNDPALYRTKLYQLIAIEQFRKYLSEYVKVQAEPYKTEYWRISLLTQSLQIRLREIGFHKIFAEKAIKIIHVLDEKKLDKELDDLGFITHHGEAEHRIFVEYFAAEYLLFGLTRDQDDFYYKHVIEMIRKKHSDKKYEQVWRILGEMLRHGNVFINFSALGVDADVFAKMPSQFDDGDIIRAHRAFFRHCLNGIRYDIDNDNENLTSIKWFVAPAENAIAEPPVAEDQYKSSTPAQLLESACQSKGFAPAAVHYLSHTDQLDDDWCAKFYLAQAINSKLDSRLATLRKLIDEGVWQSKGGYWDVDSYLPAISNMIPKLSVVAAGYFIHRIEDKKNKYCTYGIPSTVMRILKKLAQADFPDESNRLFLMMVQAWLRQVYILGEQTPIPILPAIFKKAWQCFKNDRLRAWLGVDVIFSTAFTFRLPIIVKENAFEIQVSHIVGFEPITFAFSNNVEREYYLERIKILREKSNFIQMALPEIEWTGPEKPASAAQLIAAVGSPTHSAAAKEPLKKAAIVEAASPPKPK